MLILSRSSFLSSSFSEVRGRGTGALSEEQADPLLPPPVVGSIPNGSVLALAVLVVVSS